MSYTLEMEAALAEVRKRRQEREAYLRERVAKLTAEGLVQAEIAQRLSVSKSLVTRIAQDLKAGR